MKIIYLHQYFNTPAMSGGTRSYEMARRWVAAGHEVHMVTSWRQQTEQAEWFESNEAGIHVHWLPVSYDNYMGFWRRIVAFLRFALLAGRKAASLEGEVVFATSTPLTIALPAIFAARRNQIPMVFEVRDLWPEIPIAIGALRNPIARWLALRLERFAYRNSAHVVALSQGMKDGVVATGYPQARVSVIPNSADLVMFYPGMPGRDAMRAQLGIPPERHLVVYTGTFGAINGVSYLVKMARTAKDKALPLHFIAMGEGAERPKVEALAYELGVLNDNCSLMPPVPKAEVPLVLAAADVACSFVIDMKPLWANSANKFFDGLASGTPMAINYGGWQADLLEHSGAGLILPPNDPETAAVLLAEFLSDSDKVAKAGQAARCLAEEAFSRDKLAAQLEALLRAAVVEPVETK